MGPTTISGAGYRVSDFPSIDFASRVAAVLRASKQLSLSDLASPGSLSQTFDLPPPQNESYILLAGGGCRIAKENIALLQLTTEPKLLVPRNEFAVDERDFWPTEADLILSALDAGGTVVNDRRAKSRRTYRVCAHMRLFSDQPDAEPWKLYTRDIDAKGLGFITSHRLPLGYGGTVELVNSRGVSTSVGCTVFRCRVATGNWCEGALSFNREQRVFAL